LNRSTLLNCSSFEFENLAATGVEDFGRPESGSLALALALFIPLQVVDAAIIANLAGG
jgi:hypothetical protein